MRLKTTGMALLVSACLTAGLVGTANAEGSVGDARGLDFGTSSETLADSSNDPAIEQKYSDEEVVALLLFGAGRAAQDRPDLAEIFKSPSAQGEVPEEVVKQTTAQLMAVDPDFHTQVTENAQAGDAIKAQSALKRIADDLKLVSEQRVQNPQARGWFAAEVSVWTHVMFATAVSVAAWVVGVVALLYSFENNQTALDRQNVAASLAGL